MFDTEADFELEHQVEVVLESEAGSDTEDKAYYDLQSQVVFELEADFELEHQIGVVFEPEVGFGTEADFVEMVFQH